MLKLHTYSKLRTHACALSYTINVPASHTHTHTHHNPVISVLYFHSRLYALYRILYEGMGERVERVAIISRCIGIDVKNTLPVLQMHHTRLHVEGMHWGIHIRIYHRIKTKLHNSGLCTFDTTVDNIELLPVPVLHYL